MVTRCDVITPCALRCTVPYIFVFVLVLYEIINVDELSYEQQVDLLVAIDLVIKG